MKIFDSMQDTTQKQPIPAKFAELAERLIDLFLRELRLAGHELDLKASQILNGILFAIAGILAVFVGSAVLAFAAVELLATVMESWQASLIVGLFFGLLAFLLIRGALVRLRPANLKPERTLQSVSRSFQLIKERIK